MVEEVGQEKNGDRRWAWRLCWLLFACTVLNYMDRQAVSVVGEHIQAEFKTNSEQFGWIVAAFGLSYALFQVPAGFIADRSDVRRTYVAAVIWWSLSAIAVAWSPTLGALMAFRAVLGLGESFNWPCALRVTATVLPAEDRGLGNGIFNSGAAVGAVLTPLVLTPLTIYLGWRWAFAIIGASGLVWVTFWVKATYGPAARLFQTPPPRNTNATPIPPASRIAFLALGLIAIIGGLAGFTHKSTATIVAPTGTTNLISWKVAEGATVHPGDVLAIVQGPGTTELKATRDAQIGKLIAKPGDAIQPGSPFVETLVPTLGLSALWLAVAFFMVGLLLLALAIPREKLGDGPLGSLGDVVRLRRFWVMCVVGISINVCWHFLVNWLPTILKSDRGMDFKTGTLLSAVPFLAADAGNILGGWASRQLGRRNMRISAARATVLSVCVLLIAQGALVGRVENNTVVVTMLALMALGTAAFMANYFAYAQDVSAQHTGLVVGILGGLGNLFAAGFAPVAGRIKDVSGSFNAVFVIVGLLPFVGLAAVLLGWGRDREKLDSPFRLDEVG